MWKKITRGTLYLGFIAIFIIQFSENFLGSPVLYLIGPFLSQISIFIILENGCCSHAAGGTCRNGFSNKNKHTRLFANK